MTPTTILSYVSSIATELPIAVDTGASISITPNLTDFIGPLVQCSTKTLQGLQGGVAVVGHGTVSWTVRDTNGCIRNIRTKAFYVPAARIRLLSPQTYFQEHQAGHMTVNGTTLTMVLPEGSTLSFLFSPSNNLPLIYTTSHFRDKREVVMGLVQSDVSGPTAVNALLNVANEVN